MKIVTSITLLAMLFVLVLAGTLSGAFGVEENLVQNGKIEGNVANAASSSSFLTYYLKKSDFTLVGAHKSVKLSDRNDGIIGMKGDPGRRGAVYSEFSATGNLLNHLQSGAKVTVTFSFYGDDHGDADHHCGAILSNVPSYDGDNDTYFGNTSSILSRTETNDSTGSANRKSCSIDLSSTMTSFYVAIYARGDIALDICFFDIKIEFSYSYDYSVSFSSADTAKGTVYPATSNISASTGVAETKATSTATPNVGYHFVNWTNGTTDVEFTTNSTISVSSSDYFAYKSYTANFAINKLNVKYHTNLNGSTRDDTTEVFTYNSLGTNYLKSPDKLNGHTFVGWALSENGDVFHKYGENVGNTIANVDFSKAENHGKTVHLYAVWVASDFGIVSGGSRDNGTWGSKDNPFAITTPQHLKNLSDIVNGVRYPVDSVSGTYYGQTVTTVANEITYANCYFVVTANITVSSSFERIAKDNSHYFKGNFNGQNHTIGGLNCGLFGYVSGGGTFKDLTLQGSVTSNTSDYYGGLIGYATNITVSGVTNEIVLATSNSYVGGLIGFCQNATIENCHNNANVSGIDNVGGIVGWTGDAQKVGFGSHITNSTNSGDILATGDYVGGIVGWARDTYFTDVVNSGDIKTSGEIVGGISSRVCGGSVTNAQNSGNVEGTNNVGGITGHLSWATITNVSNSGKIIGNDYVGGLVGKGESNDVSNFLVKGTLSNTGCVGGRNYVGGIAGYLENTTDKNVSIEWDATVNIANCTFGDSSGDGVRGTSYMGGAIGFLGENITISGSISVSGCDIDNENGGNYLVGGAIGYNA